MKLRILKLFWLVAICYLPIAAFAQGVRYDDVALLDTGRPVQGATVTVCASGSTGTPCTPAASIFNDSALSSPITQPGFQSGAQGNFFFYAACGKYDISITGNGITGRTKKDVQLGPVTCTRSIWYTNIPGAIFTSVGGFNQFIPDKAITVIRIDLFIAGTVATCTVAPTVNVTDGTHTVTLSIPNTGGLISQTASQGFAAGTVIKLTTTGGTCTTAPSFLQINMQYAMQ